MHFPEYILAMSVHFCKVWVFWVFCFFFVNHCDLERFYSPVRLWLLSSLFVLTKQVFVFYPFLLHVKHSLRVALLSNLLLHNILHLYGWVKLNFRF